MQAKLDVIILLTFFLLSDRVYMTCDILGL